MESLRVENFPKDNKTWIVFGYGGVVENIRGSYLAEILTKEFINGKVNQNIKINRIPVRDLDVVKIGTIWKNKSCVDDILKKEQEEEFNFDFLASPPSIVPLSQTKIYKALGYENLEPIAKAHFQDSNYLSIVTTSGTTVLIPVLEVLASIVLPDNKDLREKILIKDINTILSEYLKEYYCDESKYIINSHTEHFDRTLIFLAYLGLNNTTQQRISKLLMSMRLYYLNSLSIHPVILPFQPLRLTIQGKGKYLDDNTVLLNVVTGVKDEVDYDVFLKKVITETDGKRDNAEKKYNYISIQKKLEELDILVDGTPHFKNGHVATSTKVKRIGEKAKIVRQEKKTQIQEIDREWFKGENKTNLLSSADKNNKKDSLDITQLKSVDDTQEKEVKPPLFEQVITHIEQLENHKKIDNYCYIKENGQEVYEKFYCQFDTKKLINKKDKTWFRRKIQTEEGGKYYNRHFLIIKLNVHGKSIYLLEIERIKQNESYAGICFEAENISKELIFRLLQEIGKNKGRYTIKGENISRQLPINNYIVYAHHEKTNYICRTLKKYFGEFCCDFNTDETAKAKYL